VAPAPRRTPAAIDGDPDDLVIPAIAADGSLYPLGKLEAHRIGAQHLAVSVFLFHGDTLLIQRRAFGKYHSGGQWANTCCTHPHWGEAPFACAQRRLTEETGLSARLEARGIVDYRADVGNGLTENERVHVFSGAVDDEVPLDCFDPGEVQALRWIGRDALHDEVEADGSRFTPWLRIYLKRWDELGLH